MTTVCGWERKRVRKKTVEGHQGSTDLYQKDLYCSLLLNVRVFVVVMC